MKSYFQNERVTLAGILTEPLKVENTPKTGKENDEQEND